MFGGRFRSRTQARLRAGRALTAGLALAGLAGAVRPLPASAATVSAGAATVTAGTGTRSAVHATVASATSPSPQYGNPYWLASATGAVWPLGGAPTLGSLAGTRLDAPVVGITATPDAGGYWLVAGDGGVFSFGDAHFYGSTGGLRLDQPVIGVTPTPDGRGYWMFAADGGIFSYGDARFYGSTGNVHLAAPIVSMAPTPDARGYWLVASDGGVFNFGDAAFEGSLAGRGQTVARAVAAPGGSGYWEITHAGDVYPFGSAASASVPRLALFHPILGPGDQAMEWAMAQIGKPYQWGGVGPGSFDCSGLVMRAWQAAGVNIPRVAADQYGYGLHVNGTQLQIGDLVFWATDPTRSSTIYHVAMYIGGDHMVDAPHTGTVVQTGWVGGSDYVAAGTRP
jgi:cell wall-associated NlpC family hydrolase